MTLAHKIEQIIKDQDIKLLIFDCDGTLMETLHLHYQAWNESFLKLGYNFIPEDEFIAQYAGISGNEMVVSVINKQGYNIDSTPILANKKKIFLEKYISQVRPIEKTLNIAQKYHSNLEMVVASGGSKDTVMKMLVLNDVLKLFSQVITKEDVKLGKPDPEIFLKAAKSQNIPPKNCLVLEDHFAGFDAAVNAGMHYIDINNYI